MSEVAGKESYSLLDSSLSGLCCYSVKKGRVHCRVIGQWAKIGKGGGGGSRDGVVIVTELVAMVGTVDELAWALWDGALESVGKGSTVRGRQQGLDVD